MKITSTIALALAVSTFAATLPMSAMADRDDHRGRPPAHGAWRGDIRAFHRHDIDRWRGGHWEHGYHDGRLGWWWVIPTIGLWYLYSQPVYPYPDPYTPPVVIVNPPATAPAPGAPPPVSYWYYCESAKTYYPYVPSCPEGWKPVPATPAQ